MVGESLTERRARLAIEYPQYCTVSEVARALGISRAGVRHHKPKIKHIVVDGTTLYHRASLTSYAATFIKNNSAVSRLCVMGFDVEKLQKICEQYYKTHLDYGPPELLALAKRLAKL